MGDAIDVSDVVKAQTPGGVIGQLIGVNWTKSDRKLSSIDLFFDFVVSDTDHTKIGEGYINVSDGVIGNAINKTYDKLEAAAKVAGLEPGDDDWPVRPDVQVIWNAAKNLVGDGTGATPAKIMTMLASKNWGQWMLKREWAKSAVIDE